MKQLRKWIAVLLTVCMTISVIPTNTYAEESAKIQQTDSGTSEEEGEGETSESNPTQSTQSTQEISEEGTDNSTAYT